MTLWEIVLFMVIIGAVLFSILPFFTQWKKEGKRPVYPRKWLTAAAFGCAVLLVLNFFPPVICPQEYRDQFTPEMREAVLDTACGSYNSVLPLTAAYAKVTSVSGNSMRYVVRYFPFGETYFSWSNGTHDIIWVPHQDR